MPAQRRLVPSGAQHWNRGTLAADASRFAFCSTLAVYIYALPSCRLERLIAAHDRTITAMQWSPHDRDLMVTASVDGRCCLWRISTEDRLATLSAGHPVALAWSPHEPDCVVVATAAGKVLRWDTSQRPVGQSQVLFSVPRRVDKSSDRNEVRALRWNPRAAEALAVGLSDGSVAVWLGGGRRTKLDVLVLPNRPPTEVVALEWDALSEQYVLVAYRSGVVALWDVDETRLVHTMAKQGPGLRALAWMAWAPGNFVTISSRVGVARVWNVSQRDAPLELVRLGASGLHDIAFVPESTLAVCTFSDGHVSLFDFALKKTEFSTHPGHMETVFDAEFRPDSADVLATGSYDGTIKLWQTGNMDCRRTLGGDDGVIYGVSWAPNDDRIAAATNLGALVVFSTESGERLWAQEHHQGAVYRVDWNRGDPRLVATGSHDCTCVVSDAAERGRQVMRFKHPAAVFGCAWDPCNSQQLLTGCQDGVVRLYNVSQAAPVRTFEGHSQRVFNVCWAPHTPDLFASGSDDQSVRVWGPQTAVLNGHTHNVRALQWLPELPHVLLSGSWDSTIRVWDTRHGSCMRVLHAHSADVYALAVHPARPFTVVSCSRDTSIRFWSMTDLVSQTVAMAVALSPADALADLSGDGSRQLAQRLADPELGPIERMRRIFDFFVGSQAVSDLWDLARNVSDPGGADGSAPDERRRRQLQADFSDLGVDTSERIVHSSEVVGLVRAQAQMLESVRMRKFGSGGMGGMKREEQLERAAAAYLKVGNVKKYCDVMVELGRWEAALAVAPGAGLKFWRQLGKRYAEHLAAQQNEAAAGIFVAIDDAPAAVGFLSERHQLQDAFLVASADAEDRYRKIRAHVRSTATSAEERKAPDGRDGRSLLLDVSRRMTARLFERGEPVAAAGCHLAVGDAARAARTLMQANEVELAFAVVQTLGVRDGADVVVGALARRLEKHGMYEAALGLLRGVADADVLIETLCARAAAAVVDADELYHEAGLHPPSHYLDEAAACREPAVRLRLLALASAHAQAAADGIELLDGLLAADEWDVPALRRACLWLHNIDVAGLPQDLRTRLLARLLVVAAHEAIWVGHHPIVPALMHGAKRLAAAEHLGFPVPQAALALAEASFMINFSVQACRDALECITPAAREALGAAELVELDRLRRAVMSPLPPPVVTDVGAVVVVQGARLPAGGNRRCPVISVVSRQAIQGPEYILEDGVSAMSEAEAVMWHQAIPFSPLMTGARLFP